LNYEELLTLWLANQVTAAVEDEHNLSKGLKEIYPQIAPFSEGYNDTLLINRNFVENQKSTFNLSQFAGKQIFLPYAEELYPDLGNIAVHRKKFGF
jgi:hypothetical protein